MPLARPGRWLPAILGLGLALASAGSRAVAPAPLRFEAFGVEHGLAQGNATAILQDRKGYLWFGSQAGLTRYDGYRTLVFRTRPDDPSSLADGYVTALHEDAEGRLWVGTRGGGLQRYDASRLAFERVPADDADETSARNIRAIVGTPAHARGAPRGLWLATPDGLYSLEPRAGAAWRRIEGLPSNDVAALAWDARGRLWIGTAAGLGRREADGSITTFRLDDDADPDPRRNAVAALRVDDRGRLWIGTASGLEAWEIERERPARTRFGAAHGLATEPVRAILQDDAGGLWFGTWSGLLRWDEATRRFARHRHDVRDPNSLVDDQVDSLYQDRGGTLWVGTNTSGASRVDLRSGGFERLRLGGGDGGRDADKVYAIDGDRLGRLWFGTIGAGVHRYDPRTGAVTVYRHDPADPRSLPNDRVRAVRVDGRGAVWVGTQSGLARLDPVSQRFEVRHFADQQPALDFVRHLAIARTGELWVGTEGGLHRFDPRSGDVRTFRHDPADPHSLGQGRVITLLEDRRGVLWIGTDSGLDRFEAATGRFTHFRHDPADARSLSHDRVSNLFEDREGRLWVGSAGGLDLAVPGADGTVAFRTWTHPGSLGAIPVGAVLQDAAGRLWVSSIDGIARVDPATGAARTWRAGDGLQRGGYYVGSGYADRDGRFWYGGMAGLTAFRPEAIRDNATPPPVAITQLEVFNRPVLPGHVPDGVRLDGAIDAARTLELSHANSVFSLEFAALHFADPARNRYAYKLEGFDPDWRETDATRRFATYTNLDPGRYVFRVRAANKDGAWNDDGARLEIVVLPPWWATWWFRAAAVLAVALALWGAYRYRVRGLHRHRAQLQAEVDAAVAESVRRKDEIEQAHQHLTVLGEVGREITATLDRAAVVATLERHAHALLDATTYSIYLLDDAGTALESILDVEEGKPLPPERIALDDPARWAARCARERRELGFDLEPGAENPSQVPGTLPIASALFAPLVVGERLLGVVTVQSPRAGAYGERERVAFRSLCAYAAIALDNAAGYRRQAEADAEVQRMLAEQAGWLELEVRARTAEVERQKANLEQARATLSVLGEVGREITATLDEAEVCGILDRHVRALLETVTFAVYLLDPDGQGLTSALRVEEGVTLPVASIPVGHPTRLAARCARERQELFVEVGEGEEDPSHVPDTVVSHSMLFAPLLAGDRLLGVMTAQSPRVHAYGERERLVFRTLCAYGAIALDNAAGYRRLAEADAEVQRVLRERQQWLEKEVQVRTAEVVAQKEDLEQAHAILSVLGEIGREITASLDAADICSTLERHVHGLLPADTFSIYRLDPDGRSLTTIHWEELGQPQGSDVIDLDSATRIGARCVRERRELLIEVAPEEVNPSHIPGTLVTLSALFAPLAIGERMLGFMTIQSAREHAYGERERMVFRTLCAYGAIALDNADGYRRLAETEATLQAAVLAQQEMMDTMLAAVFTLKGRSIQATNRYLEEMIGYSREELIGRTTEIFHRDRESWEALGRQIYPQIARGEVAEGEWEHVRKDGTPIWVAFRGRALDPADPEHGSIWVAHDVTERKRAEAELERVRREQAAIFEHSAGGGILLTRDRVVVRASPGLEALLGFAPGECAGTPVRDHFADPQEFERFGAWAYPLMAQGGTATAEVEYVDRQGQPILMYVSGKAIDPNDLSRGIVWLSHDLRQQKKDAEALDRARRELQIIFDNNIGAIAVIRDGRIERCSRGFLTLYGYDADEAIGMPVEAFAVTEEESDALRRDSTEGLQAGHVVSGEFRYRRKDGSTGWLVYQGRALEPPDLKAGTIWLCQDISPLKAQEAALFASKSQVERSLVDVERMNRQVTLLTELTGFLQACPSAAEAFACIGDFGPRLFPGSAGALHLADENDAWIEHGRWGGDPDAPAGNFLGGDCWALRRSRPYRVDAPSGALCCHHVSQRAGGARPYTCLPLTAQGKTFGLLHIEYDRATGDADRRHSLAVAMAEQIALAIANVQLREALLQQSIRDPLTGLYNRRFLQESLFREIANSKRHHSPLAVLMLDVDHFKRFNDTFGHHAGDVVLQAVARVLEARFRRSDIACRFGGEEFTVLLPGTGLELAQRLANDVLHGIRDLVLSHEGRALDRVTASLGVAVFPDHGQVPQALIEAADAALYEAKSAGRNRVVVARVA